MASKACGKCGLEKSVVEYNRKESRKDGLQAWCRDCTKQRFRDYYTEHRETLGPSIYSKSKKRRHHNRRLILEVLSLEECVDCGEKDPIVLEFDHMRDKKFNLAEALDYGWETIKAEIAKCEVRCANCHRRKTARERNWYRNVGE